MRKMSASTSRLSYVDCYDIMSQALSNTKGIRLQVQDHGAGNHLRTRLHQARSIDRQDNRETYEEGHKLYGRSVYDCLVCRVKNEEGKFWLYIEKWSADAMNIEPLGEDNGEYEATNSDRGEARGESEAEPSEGEAPARTEDDSQRVAEQIEIFDAEEAHPPIQVKTSRRL